MQVSRDPGVDGCIATCLNVCGGLNGRSSPKPGFDQRERETADTCERRGWPSLCQLPRFSSRNKPRYSYTRLVGFARKLYQELVLSTDYRSGSRRSPRPYTSLAAIGTDTRLITFAYVASMKHCYYYAYEYCDRIVNWWYKRGLVLCRRAHLSRPVEMQRGCSGCMIQPHTCAHRSWTVAADD